MKTFLLITGIAVMVGAAIVVSQLSKFLPQKNTQKENSSTFSPQPTPQPAILEVLLGTVTIKGIQEKNITPPGNEILNMGDVIITHENTIAVIHYSDETLVRIGPNTTLIFTERNTTIKLKQTLGSIYVRFKKLLGINEQFEVETPTAVAVIRGTKFASFVNEVNTTKVVVTENTVDVSKTDSFDKPIDQTKKQVKENEQAEVVILGSITDPNQGIRVTPVSLTPEESKWLEFNKKANTMVDPSQLTSLITDLFTKPNPTPLPFPSVKPTPTIPTINTMPGEGYSKSVVTTDNGQFP